MNRRNLLKCLGPPILMLFAGGCVGIKQRRTQIQIAKNLNFKLLPPESFGQKISVLQNVDLYYRNRIYKTLVQLEISRKWVSLVGFTSMGIRTFTIRWSGKDLLSESHLGNKIPFNPKHIFADLQLALWPKISIKTHLQIRETSKPVPSREVLRNGVPVLRIVYETKPAWRGKIEIQHFERDYRLQISPLRINNK